MVSAWLKFIHPLTGVVCKVLAVDLDNTLWGGVLGEDGMDGIKLGVEYPGALYRGFQRAILDLYQRGVLLAVCSKNNHDEAMAALQNHPGMLLRPEHFAAFRINWQDKAQNLREIAAELNLGIDSIAFFDDNPVERELDPLRSSGSESDCSPRSRARDTRKPCAIAPSSSGSRFLRRTAKRPSNITSSTSASELAQNAGSLEDFFRSLEQEVVIANVTPETIARVAQLTQKTNQYNVTTRRYTEQQIAEFVSRPDCGVYSVRVKDRFGDNGIVGVLITRTEDDVCEIDTFLLSCRVIGRTIETAMLGFLTDASKARRRQLPAGLVYSHEEKCPGEGSVRRRISSSRSRRRMARRSGA